MGQETRSAVESFVQRKLGIGLPPTMEDPSSFKLRSFEGLDLERDSLLYRIERERGSEGIRGLNDLLEEIGRDLDEMHGSIKRYKAVNERLK